jgi:hypothetical protein
MERGREGGELGREGELLWLLVLRVRRVGCGDVEDAVAILLLVLGLIVGRSVGGIGRLGRAFVRLMVMGMVLVLWWLW